MKKAESLFSWVNPKKRGGNVKEKEQEVDRKRLRKVAYIFLLELHIFLASLRRKSEFCHFLKIFIDFERN